MVLPFDHKRSPCSTLSIKELEAMVERGSFGQPMSDKLSASTIDALRQSRSRSADDESISDPALQDALHRAAAEARERGLKAEELIILFKSVLDAIPAGPTAGDKLRRARVRERIVSLCIRAFYSGQSADS
jgi:hypothetical protein